MADNAARMGLRTAKRTVMKMTKAGRTALKGLIPLAGVHLAYDYYRYQSGMDHADALFLAGMSEAPGGLLLDGAFYTWEELKTVKTVLEEEGVVADYRDEMNTLSSPDAVKKTEQEHFDPRSVEAILDLPGTPTVGHSGSLPR